MIFSGDIGSCRDVPTGMVYRKFICPVRSLIDLNTCLVLIYETFSNYMTVHE